VASTGQAPQRGAQQMKSRNFGEAEETTLG
jgi:hypothetical protein